MQTLSKSTHKKKEKKVLPEYDSFLVNKTITTKIKSIGKTVVGGSIIRGCQRCFVAKKPYLDPSLCMMVYENTMHLGEHCHGSMVSGFRYALGAGISNDIKHKIAQMHALGLSLVQLMQQHTKKVRDLALANGIVTRDTFLLPSNVRNICRKRAEELWMKDPSDPISIRMWTEEHLGNVFFYQKHSLVDLNYSTQNDAPFTLGIHTEWQLEMMAKFGHNSALSIDATFGISQILVWYILCLDSQHILVVQCHVMSFYVQKLSSIECMCFKVSYLFVIISTIHSYGFWRLEEWRTYSFICNFLYARAGPHTSSSIAPRQSYDAQGKLVSFIYCSGLRTGWNQHIKVIFQIFHMLVMLSTNVLHAFGLLLFLVRVGLCG